MIQRAQLELRLIMISDAAIGVGVNHAARTAALDYLRAVTRARLPARQTLNALQATDPAVTAVAMTSTV